MSFHRFESLFKSRLPSNFYSNYTSFLYLNIIHDCSFEENGCFTNKKGVEKLKLSRRQYVRICQLKWPSINSNFHKKLIQIVSKAQTSIRNQFHFKEVGCLVVVLLIAFKTTLTLTSIKKQCAQWSRALNRKNCFSNRATFVLLLSTVAAHLTAARRFLRIVYYIKM